MAFEQMEGVIGRHGDDEVTIADPNVIVLDDFRGILDLERDRYNQRCHCEQDIEEDWVREMDEPILCGLGGFGEAQSGTSTGSLYKS